VEYVLGHGPYEQVEPKWRGFMGGQYVVAIVTKGLRSLAIVMPPYGLETIEIPLRYVAQQVTNPGHNPDSSFAPSHSHPIHFSLSSRPSNGNSTGGEKEASGMGQRANHADLLGKSRV